jgi:hypothetical protein
MIGLDEKQWKVMRMALVYTIASLSRYDDEFDFKKECIAIENKLEIESIRIRPHF